MWYVGIMIYQILNGEEVKELEAELQTYLPGTAKVRCYRTMILTLVLN